MRYGFSALNFIMRYLPSVLMTFTIRNCRILQEGRFTETDVLVQDGKIARIGPHNLPETVHDAKGMLLLPGMIDTHVHCREPGLTYKEDFASASAAAAAGGVTTFFDMPNTKPPTLTIEALAEKRTLAQKSMVNWGLHFGYAKNEQGKYNLEAVAQVTNIPSVKLYCNMTTGNMLVEDRQAIERLFQVVRESGKRITVHAEGEPLEYVLSLARRYGVPLHITHIASAADVAMLRAHKRQGITAEVSPHHLAFTKDDVERLNTYGIMMPPLGTEEDRRALWDALQDGTIDTFATDHAPHTHEDKRSQTCYGVPGLETALPYLLTQAHTGKIDWARVPDIIARMPAQIYGVPERGELREGYAADLVLCDLGPYRPVLNETLNTKCRWSPFAGMAFTGWPVLTWVNGNLVYDHGKLYNVPAQEIFFRGIHDQPDN